MPTESNHRANIFALCSLNVRWIISVGVVGTLQEKYTLHKIVLPSQFFDRTSQWTDPNFFWNRIVTPIGFADLMSKELWKIIITWESVAPGYKVHNHGNYVNIDGDTFKSTRMKSAFHRKLEFDVIRMINLPETKLAREAEILLASVNFVIELRLLEDRG